MDKIETFVIKGIEIRVQYNTNLYTHEDIETLLSDAIVSEDDFDEVTSEIDILNYNEVYNKLFEGD